MPDIEDLHRAYDLFGTPPEYVRGKMTKRKVGGEVINQNIIMEERRQALTSDVMHIDGKSFLVTTCESAYLTIKYSK